MSQSPIVPTYSFAAVKSDRRARFDPLREITPEKLINYLDEFRAGQLRNLAYVMDAIEERDDMLAAVVPKAKAAVTRHGWDVLTVDTEQTDLAQQQKEVLEDFYNNLNATSAMDQDELGGMRLLLRQMMDAKGKRYSCHNIVWRPQPGGRYHATLHHVPLWFFENTEGRMRFIGDAYGYYGKAMEPGRWLVTKGQGCMIACAIAWMFKHLPLRDWLVYCSRHGMPGIEGVTSAAEGSEEWNALVTAVTAAATEFAWVRNQNSEIKTIDFGSTGELPFPALIDRMDRAMAAIWRGADLSTLSAGTGAGDGASLQGGEADIIEQDDAAWLGETLDLKLSRLVLDYTFGKGVPALAYLKILSGSKEDLRLQLDIDRAAIELGHPISTQQFAERYSRPLPDAGDVLLKSQPTAPALSNGSFFSAANESKTAPSLAAEIAAELAVPASWLAPLQGWFSRLEEALQNPARQPDEIRQFLEAAQHELPDLFADMDHAALADVFDRAMSAAAIDGARQSLQLRAPAGVINP